MEWLLRPQEDRYVYGSKEIPDYKAPDLFSIKLYHGGDFDEYMSKYTGGKVDFVDCCDVDKLSMLELRDMLNQCVDDKSCAADFFYKNPEDSIEKGLMPLECDADVITMVQMVPATHMIEVFVLLTRPLAVDNLTISSAPTPPELVDLDEPQFDSDEATLEERNLVNNILDGEGVHKTFSEEEAERVQDKRRKGRKRKGKKEKGKSTVVEDDAFPDVEVGSWHDDTSNKDMSDNDAEFEAFIHSTNFEEFIKQRNNLADVGNELAREGGGSSENAGGNGNEVNMGNARGETDGNGIEENMDPTGNEQNESEAEFEGFPDSDYAASDEERMAKSSDDEADCVYPEFNEKMDMKNPKFELGMLFSSAAVLRHAIRTQAILERRGIKRTPNMGSKVQFVCRPPCEWRIYASKTQKSDSIQIKFYQPVHTCQPTWDQSQISAEWIAWKYEEDIKMNVKWEADALQKKVVNDLKCEVKKCMIYRAKDIALGVIKGSHEKQFGLLWDYLNEVRKAMPGSSLFLETEDKQTAEERGIFKRLYICLDPVKKGFLSGCRPLVGLDGCHLKGPFGGQLLTAVGVDPNNGMYPVAWAVVDVENTENWMWFISCLKNDLNIENSGAWTFISDKQKGLVNSLQQLCPDAEHRFCVMHLYRNMWKDHKGIGLRMLLWSAARSTTDYHFDIAMAELKKLNKKCYEWLVEKPKSQWSRSGFRWTVKSDMFVNNHCEVFNSAIRKYRHLPIVTMLKEIHRGVMTRIQKRRAKMESWTGRFCPNAIEKLNQATEKGNNCEVDWNGGHSYQVRSRIGGFELVVNLNNKSCVCQKWQLSGVPCFHAAASYRYKGFDPQDGIHESYSIEKFRETYNHFVEPINGEHFWERTPYPRPLPPDVKVAPGRPKKKRSRKNDITEDGVELKRQNTSISCGYCREFGHNRKTCPAKKNDEAQGGAQGGVQTATTEVFGADVLGGADQHTTQTRASQPQTQSSQTTEAAAVKKRRGRPKKQPPCAPLTKEQRKQLLTPSSP